MDTDEMYEDHQTTYDFYERCTLLIRSCEMAIRNLLSAISTFMENMNGKVTRQQCSTRPGESSTLEVLQPSCELKDIAGLQDIKNALKSAVLLPRYQPQLFRGTMNMNTILLYGPPGTGKTRLVNAIAAEAGAILVSLSAGSIMSPYVGSTEKNIVKIFNELRSASDKQFSILFIDEIDGLCRKRTSKEQEFSTRIKTELMMEINKIDSSRNVIIIAATNCPWNLDSAVLRRFKKRLYVPLPNDNDRIELIRMLTNTVIIFNKEEENYLVQVTKGYSGSDLFCLVNDAFYIPLTELQDTFMWNITSDGLYEPIPGNFLVMDNADNVHVDPLYSLPQCSVKARQVTMCDFFQAVASYQITVSQEELDKYDHFRQHCS